MRRGSFAPSLACEQLAVGQYAALGLSSSAPPGPSPSGVRLVHRGKWTDGRTRRAFGTALVASGGKADGCGWRLPDGREGWGTGDGPARHPGRGAIRGPGHAIETGEKSGTDLGRRPKSATGLSGGTARQRDSRGVPVGADSRRYWRRCSESCSESAENELLGCSRSP